MSSSMQGTAGTSYTDEVRSLESKMQHAWAASGIDRYDPDSPRPKRFVLGMFPYPSGRAHLGHALVYSISDAVARLSRFQGYAVLHPIGWDAFGLPAENAATMNNARPADWTASNIAAMRRQIEAGGFSLNWSQEFSTADPRFYRWTQWLFLKLVEHGQAYRGLSWVNWDPVDKTVLANEQVIDGRGWRSGAPIERRQMQQWCLRITDFAQALHDGLDELTGWSPRALSAQHGWIGRSEGLEIDFALPNNDGALTVYTTQPHTVFGVTSVTIAPDHPLVAELTTPHRRPEVQAYIERALQRTELERQSDDSKTGVPLGTDVVNPANGERVPIWISDYVVSTYGTGAIMNVPAHDQRDWDFAEIHGLPVRTVIEAPEETAPPTEAFTSQGVMRDSGCFTGMDSIQAISAVAEWLEESGVARRATKFRLRDWSLGRQRYWGAPIPMLKMPDGTWEGVPESELPVLLPDDVDFSASDAVSPLETSASFSPVALPDGRVAERAMDTMDTFMDSAWYAWRFLELSEDMPFAPEKAAAWTPLHTYVGGIEHATQHMIYFRYISHFLHSIGLLPTREPVVNFLDNGIVKLDGSKMSKSKGNTISPDDIIDRYGADTLRLYLLSDSPFDKDRDWDESGLQAKHRFLGGIWSTARRLAEIRTPADVVMPDGSGNRAVLKLLRTTSAALVRIADDVENRRSFHTAIARLHTLFGALRPLVSADLSDEDRDAVAWAYTQSLKGLALFAPHLADYAWRTITGRETTIFEESWPEVTDQTFGRDSELTIGLQVNGKFVGPVEVGNARTDEEIIAVVEAGLPDRARRRIGSAQVTDRIVVRDRTSLPRTVNIVTR